MPEHDLIIVFTLDDQRYALPLHVAQRVVRIVAISALPKAPDIVSGVINVMGTIVPVIDMRRRFALPPREIELTDQLIIASTATDRKVALIVDEVVDVMAYQVQNLIEMGRIVPGTNYLAGVVKLDDGLIFINDLDSLLSLEEKQALDQALQTD